MIARRLALIGLLPALLLVSTPASAATPTAPVGLHGSANVPFIELEWTAPAGDVTSYVVYQGTTATSLTQVDTTETTWWDGPALAAGAHAFYAVAAVSGDGMGERTAPLELAGTATQLIIGQASPTKGLLVASLLPSGGPGVTLIEDGMVHEDISVNYNGTLYAYTAAPLVDGELGPRQIYVGRTDGSAPVHFAASDDDEYAPAWWTCCPRLSYARDDGTSVSLCPFGNVDPDTPSTAPEECMHIFSRDGFDNATWINKTDAVAVDFTGDDTRLVRIRVDGGPSPIAGTTGADLPSASPDGRQIAFLVPGPTDFSEVIRVIDLVTHAVRSIPAPSGKLFSRPSWTRDGKALYVAGFDDASSAVYKLSASGGSTITVLTGNPGEQFAVAVGTKDLTPPTTPKLAPLPPVTLDGKVTPRLTATDALNQVGSYRLRWDRATPSGTSFQRLVRDVPSWATTVAISPGYSYCFTGQAIDTARNLSVATSNQQCTMAPLDERLFSRSAGWTSVGDRGFYASTGTTTNRIGATLNRSGFAGIRQVSVVARTCPTCGIVDVLVAGVKVGSINTVSATVVNRRVFVLPSFSVRSGSITLRTMSAKTVTIDAVGFRK